MGHDSHDGQAGAGRGHGLLRHSFLYSLTPVVRYALSLGMTRFYTSVLIVGLYGVKEVLDLWMILLQQLLGQNLLSGLLRFYYDQREPAKRDRVVTSTTLVLTLCAFGVAALLLLGSSTLAPLMIGRPTPEVSGITIERAFRYMVLLVPFQLATLSGMQWLLALKRSGLYSGVQSAKLLLEIASHVVLMGVLDLGLEGFLIGLLIGEASASLLLTGTMLVKLGPRIDLEVLRPVLRYSLPLVPVGVFQFCLHQLDRRLIELSFSGAEGLALVGVYGLGYKVGQIVNTAGTWSFMQIWQPTLFGLPEGAERTALVGRVTTWVVVGAAAASLPLVCAARPLVLLLAGRPEYHAAYTVVPWVAAGYVFWALYLAAQLPLFLAKRTAPLAGINAAALVVAVGANLLLIPEYGIRGAAWATLIAFASLASLGLLAARRHAPVPFEPGRLLAVIALFLVACLGVTGTDPPVGVDASYHSGALRRIAILAAGWGALWFGVLRSGERAAVRDALARRLSRRGTAP